MLYAAEKEKLAAFAGDPDMEVLRKGILTGIAGSILSETLCRSVVQYTIQTYELYRSYSNGAQLP